MALGWWKWRSAKWRLAWSKRRRESNVRSRAWINGGDPSQFPVTLQPYARLAEYWNDVAVSFVPHYGEFLDAVRQRFDVPIQSVLDVACGAGLISGDVGTQVEHVVGIDLSEAMLQRARWENPQVKFRFEQADFRDFHLQEKFDAAICGSDSLNYVASTEELAAVFRCVASALKPGGLFIFDVLTERAFKATRNVTVGYKVNGSELQQNFYYDAASRRGECRVSFADGSVESHCRIPLNAAEVQAAASASGLIAKERFSGAGMIGVAPLAMREFWILRKA